MRRSLERQAGKGHRLHVEITEHTFTQSLLKVSSTPGLLVKGLVD